MADSLLSGFNRKVELRRPDHRSIGLCGDVEQIVGRERRERVS